MEKEIFDRFRVCRKHCLDCNLEELQNRIDRVLELADEDMNMDSLIVGKILRGESH